MFEKHDQLVMEVATQYLMNAMQNYEKNNPEAIKEVVDEETAELFVLNFLKYSNLRARGGSNRHARNKEDLDSLFPQQEEKSAGFKGIHILALKTGENFLPSQ